MIITIKNLSSSIKIEADQVATRTITPFGNGAKIDAWIKYKNRDALVIIPKKRYKIKVDENCNQKKR